jgi:C4-dicarboxylate-specific signal transduction histidine kinase/ActR/RegA family two-component response regulator
MSTASMPRDSIRAVAAERPEGAEDAARLLEFVAGGAVLVDLVRRTVLGANDAFLRLSGFTGEDLPTLDLTQLHDLGDLEWILRVASRPEAGAAVRRDLTCLGKNEAPFQADLTVRSLAAGGGRLAVLLYARGAPAADGDGVGTAAGPAPAAEVGDRPAARLPAFTRRLAAAQDREELGRVAMEAAAELIGCEVMLLVGRHGAASGSEAIVSAGLSGPTLDLAQRQLDDQLAGAMIVSGGPQVVALKAPEDAAPETIEALRSSDVRCLLVFPLESEGRIIGAWALGFDDSGRAAAADLELGQTFAVHLAGALGGVLVLERTRREKMHHEVLNRIISWIGGPFDLDRALHSLTEELSRALDVNRSLVLLAATPGEEPEQLDPRYEYAAPGLTTAHSRGPIPFAGTSLGQAVLFSRQALSVDDLRMRADLTEHHEALVEALGLRSLIVSKISSRQEFVGVVVVAMSGRARPWTTEEVELVDAVADHISVMLEAGRLARAREELFTQIERERREWERTFDAIPDMLSVHDGYGRLLRANLALQLRLGGDPRPFVGRSCGEILETVVGRTAVCPHEEAQRVRRPIASELQGEMGFFTLTAIPCFDQSGQCLYIVHVCTEITEEKQIREQLMQTEKMAAVGNLVSGVAHELNNPLAGVIGFSQILLERTQDAKARKSVERIHDEAQRAARIVRNLLTFARKHKPESVKMNVNAVIEKTLELRAYDLRVNSITVTTELGANLPRTMADPNQLQQVILNIVSNAEQAMREAHGKGALRVSTRAAEKQIRIDIQDDGPGIKKEHLKQIFDPFFTTKPVGKGTGLGLSICLGIIKEHGGTIEARSPAEGGTVFTILLPVLEGPEARPEDTAARPAPPPAPPSSILVVDDEASMRELALDVLATQGHRVDAVESGEKALQALAGRTYDLIISDLKMPGIDGQELYRRLQAAHPDLARRVLFTSGDTVSVDTRSFLERCGRPYLLKPFRVEDLVEQVRKVLIESAPSSSPPGPGDPSQG